MLLNIHNVYHTQEDIESEDEGGVFMDLSNMKETRDLEVCTYITTVHVIFSCMY